MKNCPICGAALSDDAVTCNVCGAQLTQEQGAYNAYQQGADAYNGYQQQAQDAYNGYQQQGADAYNGYQQQAQGAYNGYQQQAQGAYNGYQQQAPQGGYGFPQGADQQMQGQFNGQYQQQGYDQFQQPYDPYGQGQGQFGAPPAKAPGGNGKKIGIIIGCIVLVAGLGVLAYFLFFKDKVSQGSAAAVAESFCDALADFDTDRMLKCVPESMRDEGDIASAASTFSSMKDMGLKINVGKVSESKIDSSEKNSWINKLDSRYSLKADDVAEVTAELSMEFMGEKETEEVTMVCAKIGGSWYVVDFDD